MIMAQNQILRNSVEKNDRFSNTYKGFMSLAYGLKDNVKAEKVQNLDENSGFEEIKETVQVRRPKVKLSDRKNKNFTMSFNWGSDASFAHLNRLKGKEDNYSICIDKNYCLSPLKSCMKASQLKEVAASKPNSQNKRKIK